MASSSPESQCGFTLAAWCESTSISRPKLYTLPPELQPRSIKIGRRRIIIEAPADYLQRIATAQEGSR
jgi:hypothetical protein